MLNITKAARDEVDFALAGVFPRNGHFIYFDSTNALAHWIITRFELAKVWQFRHENTETHPDGEGGIEASDARHGLGSSLLNCIEQIEDMVADSLEGAE